MASARGAQVLSTLTKSKLAAHGCCACVSLERAAQVCCLQAQMYTCLRQAHSGQERFSVSQDNAHMLRNVSGQQRHDSAFVASGHLPPPAVTSSSHLWLGHQTIAHSECHSVWFDNRQMTVRASCWSVKYVSAMYPCICCSHLQCCREQRWSSSRAVCTLCARMMHARAIQKLDKLLRWG